MSVFERRLTDVSVLREEKEDHPYTDGIMSEFTMDIEDAAVELMLTGNLEAFRDQMFAIYDRTVRELRGLP